MWHGKDLEKTKNWSSIQVKKTQLTCKPKSTSAFSLKVKMLSS